MKAEVFDSFPGWMAVVGFGVGASIYAMGAYVLSRFGILVGVAYLGYCVFVELAILRGSCVDCHYYGKVCGLGRGRLCPLLFKRGDPERFLRREISFRSLIPDFLVPVIPLIGGVVGLVVQFEWIVLVLTLAILVLGSAGTALVRGAMACRHCAQRELGCPAQKLFARTGA